MSECCRHGYVSGRVQGVAFRAFVRAQAQRVNVRGWAKNLPDGRVEVLLCGAEDDVQVVAEALRRGPPHAVVTAVTLQPRPVIEVEGFSVG